jgi:mRNA interferase RelE/StbE
LAYKVLWDSRVEKDLLGLDGKTKERIINKVTTYLNKNPESLGKKLSGEYSSYYRYRENNWRVICSTNKKEKNLTVYKVGHRKEIYKDFGRKMLPMALLVSLLKNNLLV